jgi:PEP-CTERM motif-containing protein
MVTISPNYSFFAGSYLIASSTSGFVSAGFPVGATIDLDFVTHNGTLSSSEVVPAAVPEPGTIALVGSGLLAAAGFLGCKI